MKKYFLYTMAAMASLALASCDEDFDDWSEAQSNDQESAAAYNVSLTAGPDTSIKMDNAGETLQLVAISSSSDEISGYILNSITVNGMTIEASIDEENCVAVDAAELAKAVESYYFSRAAETRTLEVVTSVSVELSNGDVITAETTTTTATFTDYAVPEASDGYYMLGDWQNWDLANPTVMELQSDGTYMATVTTTSSGDNWYKFYRGDTYSTTEWDSTNSGAIGSITNGDGTLQNLAVYEGDPLYSDGVQTPVISGEGTFEITFDPANLTYTIVRAEARYYLIGNMQAGTGWDITSVECIFYAKGSNTYSYTTKWQSSWDMKFVDSKNLGSWDTAVCWGTEVDGDDSTSGSLTNSNAQSFEAPSAEYYTLTIDMNTQTYEWTLLDNQSPTTYTYVSLIGDFNSWADDVDLVEEENAPHNWYLRTTIDSDGGLKFRADHDWTTSWGTSSSESIGDTYYLSTGSDNITVPAGTYDFYLNDITGLFCIVPVEE